MDIPTILGVITTLELVGIGFYVYWKLKEVLKLPILFGEQLKSFGEVLKSAKMSDLGKLSGESRQMKALNLQGMVDSIGQTNPMIAAVIESNPQIKRYAAKYPFLVPMVAGFISKLDLSALGIQKGNGQTNPAPNKKELDWLHTIPQ